MVVCEPFHVWPHISISNSGTLPSSDSSSFHPSHYALNENSCDVRVMFALFCFALQVFFPSSSFISPVLAHWLLSFFCVALQVSFPQLVLSHQFSHTVCSFQLSACNSITRSVHLLCWLVHDTPAKITPHKTYIAVYMALLLIALQVSSPSSSFGSPVLVYCVLFFVVATILPLFGLVSLILAYCACLFLLPCKFLPLILLCHTSFGHLCAIFFVALQVSSLHLVLYHQFLQTVCSFFVALLVSSPHLVLSRFFSPSAR